MAQQLSDGNAFRNAIFAGGGSRCFWQLGFWDGANAAGLNLSDTVDYAASTSAGCAIATAAMLDRGREALDIFKNITARNPRNVHWQNLLPGSTGPLLPHMGMYRGALKQFLTSADMDYLAEKRIEFLISTFPPLLPGGLGALVAFTIYGLEKHLSGVVHPLWTQKLGFKPLVQGNHDAEGVDDLIDMIIAASCVPPVLSAGGFRGMQVLDGGIIDNVPAHLANGREGRTLVLLSKRYKKQIPQVPGRVYVQPGEPIRIDKFDYANPSGLQETYDLGIQDGAMFATSILS